MANLKFKMLWAKHIFAYQQDMREKDLTHRWSMLVGKVGFFVLFIIAETWFALVSLSIIFKFLFPRIG